MTPENQYLYRCADERDFLSCTQSGFQTEYSNGFIMRLLFVDDNTRMRRFLMTVVGDLLTDSCEAANGLEAVEKYERFHPDAVLMDIRMPFLDGFEATRRILRTNPDARILIVTDFDTPEYRLLAERAGAAGYIVKDRLFDLPAALKALAS